MQEKEPKISKILLEERFLFANKELQNLSSLQPTFLGKYLYSKGFRQEALKLYREHVD
jgi:hypothetical protein